MKKKMKKARKEGHNKVILHMKCVAGRIVDRSVEDLDNLESSMVCFSNEYEQAHCQHVLFSGQDIDAKIRNCRWPSESKLL